MVASNILTFGKYKGISIKSVFDMDKNYLSFVVKKGKRSPCFGFNKNSKYDYVEDISYTRCIENLLPIELEKNIS